MYTLFQKTQIIFTFNEITITINVAWGLGNHNKGFIY